ncbi:MAG: hypothetical protein Q7S60_02155 [bacterium]|nr:hypothetical protein [bacterium]
MQRKGKTRQNSPKIYTSGQLRELVSGKKWIMSYNRLTAIVDSRSGEVMYIEDYGPENGFFTEGWRAFHFPRTSSLVKKSYREGNITINILEQGKAKLHLVPSFAPIGIQECEVKGGKVEITIAGFGGGGVSAAFSRGMAQGVEKVQVVEEGGGNRLGVGKIILPARRLLLVGVDDTDNETEGATYSLVHNLSLDVAKKLGVEYVIQNNVQLYPKNPYKTKNCMATVVGFIYDKPSQRQKAIKEFASLLKKYTLSSQTGMATYDGFSLPKGLRDFCTSLKFRLLEDMKEVYTIAARSNVKLYPITGEKGLIGAVAAIGFYDDPDFAAKLPS